jgi:hypothetical protein
MDDVTAIDRDGALRLHNRRVLEVAVDFGQAHSIR